MDKLNEGFVAIFTAIIGVAILSVILSNRSNTTGVLQAFGSMFSNALGVATAPVTGANVNINTTYPGGMSGVANLSAFGGGATAFPFNQ